MSELITLDKVKSSIKNLKRRKGIDSMLYHVSMT